MHITYEEEIKKLNVFLKEVYPEKFFLKFRSAEDLPTGYLPEYSKWQEFFPEIFLKMSKTNDFPEYIAYKILKSLRKNVQTNL